MEMILEITELGHQGDGLARTADGVVAVPYCLPGEKVKVALSTDSKKEATLLEVVETSPHRVTAPCSYFGVCGGCALQHLDLETYGQFKCQKILGALNQQGLSAQINEPIFFPSKTRRRVGLKAQKAGGKVEVGYHQRSSHRIVDVLSCPLVVPTIEEFFKPLKEFLHKFLSEKEKVEIFITKTDGGLDVGFQFKKRINLSLTQRENLIEFSKVNNLARLSLLHENDSETIVCFEAPTVSFDGVSVAVGAKSFLQVSSEVDDVLAELLLSSLPENFKRAADLFCGRGTLSLPLSNRGKVDGFEMDKDALKALQDAAKKSGRPINTVERNLFSEPLLVNELNKYDVIVLDPPRVGAHAQAKELAKSQIPLVFMVSCNAASFARDAKILIDGGYELGPITPIDQFLWSPHIEMTALFRR